jgi:hypothetical protein
VRATLQDVMPPEVEESPRVPFTGAWAKHREMATWHWYDSAFSWSLCRGSYAYSLDVMERGDGSGPNCCAGCAVVLADRRLHAA